MLFYVRLHPAWCQKNQPGIATTPCLSHFAVAVNLTSRCASLSKFIPIPPHACRLPEHKSTYLFWRCSDSESCLQSEHIAFSFLSFLFFFSVLTVSILLIMHGACAHRALAVSLIPESFWPIG